MRIWPRVMRSRGRAGMVVWGRDDLRALQKRGARAYHEAFRSEALSLGVYALPAGGRDAQRPHAEDELYFVLSGRAELVSPRKRVVLRAGAIAFVAAGVPHRFERIGRDFVVAVAFAPPESDKAPPARRPLAARPSRRAKPRA